MTEGTSEVNVAIVGAGISGLTAALRLSQRGYKVTVYEEKDFIGGSLGAQPNEDKIYVAVSSNDPHPTPLSKEQLEKLSKQLDEGHLPDLATLPPANLPPSETASVAVLEPGKEWRITAKDGTDDYVVRLWHSPPLADGSQDQKLIIYKEPHYEHSFHMYLNWYNNFWKIVEEDLAWNKKEHFEPKTQIGYLRRGEFPHMSRLVNVGSLNTVWANLTSGLNPVPDAFLSGYSLIDLLATHFQQDDLLSLYSLNGFMASRWYATTDSAHMYEYTLAKAFALPSFNTSASSFKEFIKYGYRHPDPMLWVLKGNVYWNLMRPLERKLEQLGCKIFSRTRLEDLNVDKDDGRVIGIDWTSTDVNQPIKGYSEVDYLILAIDPTAMQRLAAKVIEWFVRQQAQSDNQVWNPAWDALYAAATNVRRLQTEPVATLHLYFKKKLPDIPKEHVILLGSSTDLSFVDESQSCAQDPGIGSNTYLSVAASNPFALPLGDTDTSGDEILERGNGRLMLYELYNFMPVFDPGKYWGDPDSDIDWEKSRYRTNLKDEIFTNTVGSWQFRPETTYDFMPNLLFAGDYTRNFINVVTVEGAVVSGLEAAKALHTKQPLGPPIEIIKPDSYPEMDMMALLMLGAPLAAAAKWWSMANDLISQGFGSGPSANFASNPVEPVWSFYNSLANNWWEAARDAYRGMFRR